MGVEIECCIRTIGICDDLTDSLVKAVEVATSIEATAQLEELVREELENLDGPSYLQKLY